MMAIDPTGAVLPPPVGRTPEVSVVPVAPPFRMMMADPVSIVVPPPGGGMPHAILVEVTPPGGMIMADPIGIIGPPPAGVMPFMALVVSAPVRILRRSGRREKDEHGRDRDRRCENDSNSVH